MDRDFEEGYTRHLTWHRKNDDGWTWYGWTTISGEHFGYFVDGTFFHAWSDLDSPVNPEQIGDPTLADDVLDRLVHNAHRIEMRGDSMRKNRGKTNS